MRFIHEKAVIEGDVKLGDNVSVWACAVIRGDEGKITVGNNTSIQEHVTVHGKNVRIGNNVTVGHNAVIHGAKISENCLIGIGSVLLDNCSIGSWCIVAAGSVVPPGAKIPRESVVMGIPGKVVRKASAEDKKLIKESCLAYLKRIRE